MSSRATGPWLLGLSLALGSAPRADALAQDSAPGGRRSSTRGSDRSELGEAYWLQFERDLALVSEPTAAGDYSVLRVDPVSGRPADGPGSVALWIASRQVPPSSLLECVRVRHIPIRDASRVRVGDLRPGPIPAEPGFDRDAPVQVVERVAFVKNGDQDAISAFAAVCQGAVLTASTQVETRASSLGSMEYAMVAEQRSTSGDDDSPACVVIAESLRTWFDAFNVGRSYRVGELWSKSQTEPARAIERLAGSYEKHEKDRVLRQSVHVVVQVTADSFSAERVTSTAEVQVERTYGAGLADMTEPASSVPEPGIGQFQWQRWNQPYLAKRRGLCALPIIVTVDAMGDRWSGGSAQRSASLASFSGADGAPTRWTPEVRKGRRDVVFHGGFCRLDAEGRLLVHTPIRTVSPEAVAAYFAAELEAAGDDADLVQGVLHRIRVIATWTADFPHAPGTSPRLVDVPTNLISVWKAARSRISSPK